MTKPTKKQISILKKTLKNIKKYPASFGSKLWISHYEPLDGDRRKEILPESESYKGVYKNTNASLAGHIALTIGCPAKSELTRADLPKGFRKLIEKHKPSIDLADLVAKILGGSSKQEFENLFFEEDWPEPYKSDFVKAQGNLTQQIEVLHNRVDFFIKTGK